MMRVLSALFVFLLFSLCAWCGPIGESNGSKFEFSKAIYKVKGTIKKINGDYVIIPDEKKNETFVPTYLPEEYKKNGLEVTFDGELGQGDKSGTPLNLHKIWVAYEIKEKYKLAHKNYDLN